MLVNKHKSTGLDNKGFGDAIHERRQAQRFRVHWEVTLRGINGKANIFDEVGYLKNLSSTGALVNLARRPELGARLSIRITIPFKKRSRIGYSAIVVRAEEEGRRVHVGLVFETPRPSFVES